MVDTTTYPVYGPAKNLNDEDFIWCKCPECDGLILIHGSKERMLTLTNGQLTIIICIKKCKSRRGSENNTLALKPVETTGHL
jgi:hypothetical protein